MISSMERFKHVIKGEMESALVSIIKPLSYESLSWSTRYVLILLGPRVDERGGSAVQACTLIIHCSFAFALLSTLWDKMETMKMIVEIIVKTKSWIVIGLSKMSCRQP